MWKGSQMGYYEWFGLVLTLHLIWGCLFRILIRTVAILGEGFRCFPHFLQAAARVDASIGTQPLPSKETGLCQNVGKF